MLRQHFGFNMIGQFLASEFVLINFDLDTCRYNERKHYDLIRIRQSPKVFLVATLYYRKLLILTKDNKKMYDFSYKFLFRSTLIL